MMDTVLNLGLNDESVIGLAERTRRTSASLGTRYRRLVQMFGNVVRGVPGERFEEEIARVKRERGVSARHRARRRRRCASSTAALPGLSTTSRGDPREQLTQAIRAVFDSWLGDRAVSYRRINRIPDDWGTAVNVQQMVFGNKGETSGSGVAFSRDELTGAPEPSGDFLAERPGRGRRLRRADAARPVRAARLDAGGRTRS